MTALEDKLPFKVADLNLKPTNFTTATGKIYPSNEDMLRDQAKEMDLEAANRRKPVDIDALLDEIRYYT